MRLPRSHGVFRAAIRLKSWKMKPKRVARNGGSSRSDERGDVDSVDADLTGAGPQQPAEHRQQASSCRIPRGPSRARSRRVPSSRSTSRTASTRVTPSPKVFERSWMVDERTSVTTYLRKTLAGSTRTTRITGTSAAARATAPATSELPARRRRRGSRGPASGTAWVARPRRGRTRTKGDDEAGGDERSDLDHPEVERTARAEAERAQDPVVAQLCERLRVGDEAGDGDADDEADEDHRAHDVGRHVADDAPLGAPRTARATTRSRPET